MTCFLGFERILFLRKNKLVLGHVSVDVVDHVAQRVAQLHTRLTRMVAQRLHFFQVLVQHLFVRKVRHDIVWVNGT